MEVSEDNLYVAALVFEQANGNRLDENDVRLIQNAGLGNCAPEFLEAALVEALTAEPPASYRSMAYWALSKRFNNGLIPLFKKWMHRELGNQESGAVYQLLIALDNLEEPVFGSDRNGSVSAADTLLNVRDATIYLEKNA